MSEPTRAKRAHVPVEQRRNQLVRAAMEIMQEDGAWGLTTRAVAQRAGVPLGAVHYAFDSKADLIAAVFAADIDSAAQLIRGAAQRFDDPVEALDSALRESVARLGSAPGTELVLQELTLMGARDPELGELARRSVEGYRVAMTRFLEELAATRGLVWDLDVRVLGELVFAQLVGLAQNWLVGRDDELLDACVAQLGETLVVRLRRRDT